MAEIYLYVDESYIAPDTVLIAVVSVVGEAYKKFVSEKIDARKKTRPYQEHDAKLHHTEDHPSIRSDIASWIMRTAPLSAYLLIQKVDSGVSESDAKLFTYKQTLPKIIFKNILRKYERNYAENLSIEINFENITDNTASDQKFFQQCIAPLGHKNIEVNVITKKNVLTVLPDYIAGIIRTCSENSKKNPGGVGAINASLIREKLGLLAVCSSEGRCKYLERGEEIEGFIHGGCVI